MPVSELKLIKRCVEFLPQEEIGKIPQYTRGIYALYKYNPESDNYDVVYMGMAAGTKTASIPGRLRVHKRRKGKLWSHFSVYEVWDNIREEEVQELEGIFRHIYRKDTQASKLNKQRAFKKLIKIRSKTKEENWIRH